MTSFRQIEANCRNARVWQLQEETNQRLTVRLASEKRQLDGQLAQLRGTKGIWQSEPSDAPSLESELRAQRKYPRDFQNSAILRSLPRPGRSAGNNHDGWLLLKTGHTIAEFV